MSRAFRDTFKQTFCHPCQKYDRRDSAVSCAQLTIKKQQKYEINSSIAFEPLSTYKCFIDQPTNLTSIENYHCKKQKLSLPNFNNQATMPLLIENRHNGLQKHNSCA